MHELLPQEYVARKIIPLLRGAIASCLKEKGVSQHKISRLLGVTQPMIHKYLKHDREYYLNKLGEEGILEGTLRLHIDIACDRIQKTGPRELAITANFLALESNYCKKNPLCMQVLQTGENPYLKAYYKILEDLLDLPIHDLIPEVGSNLAYAPANAQDLTDVIGLDGRIIKASGRVIIAGSPTKGGSKHTGRVALKYSRYWKSEAWATVIRYMPSAISISNENENIAFEVEMGEGVEPVIYIVARDPYKLIKIINKIIKTSRETK